MTKRISTVMAVLATAVASFAAEYNLLNVEMRDGSNVTISLSEDLLINFDAQNLIAADGTSEVVLDRNNIKQFTHGFGSGVNTISPSESITLQKGAILFYNLPEDSSITLADMSGVVRLATRTSGSYTLPLEGLESGAYVLTVNKVSHKIRIR